MKSNIVPRVISAERVLWFELIALLGVVATISQPVMGTVPQNLASITTTDANGTVSLVITDDPEPVWYQSKFTPTELTDPAISGPYADPDGDGLSNILERTLALEPRIRDNAGFPFPGGKPDGRLSLSFFRLRSATDMDPMVEHSTDLLHWHVGNDFTFTNHVVNNGLYDSWEETSAFTSPQQSNQFMRVHAVRPSRTNFLDALHVLNDTPAEMLADAVIATVPPSPMQGAVTISPRRYGYPNYVVKWYFSNVALYHFVKTHKDLVKTYLIKYVAHLQLDYSIRDIDLYANMQTILDGSIRPDSDDAYAGTFLRLAAHFALVYPDDPWFDANLEVLKHIADANITNEIKPNHLTRVHQNGEIVGGTSNYGYLMDNVEAWAGIAKFVEALVFFEKPEAARFKAVRDELQYGIHTELWDENKKAWKWADVNSEATFGKYYPDLMCQYFPELYGLPHPSGEAETNRRYDAAWQWIVTHKPDWYQVSGWTPDAVDIHRHETSDMALAYVAARRGELEKSRAYMALAIKNWIPDPSRPSNPFAGTLIPAVGYWQALLNGAIPKPATVNAFAFTDQPSVQAGGTVRSDTTILSGFTGSLTAVIPAGSTLFVNGVARTGSSTSVFAGDTVWLETTAPSTPGVTKILTLKIGTVSSQWCFTSAAMDAVPDQPGQSSGYTPVEVSVSGAGASRISIPIVVSPGTRLQPQLAITYSSSGGAGPLGLGFGLSGLSSITRVPATRAQDGFKGGVSFNSNDRFAFDGKRLILVGGTSGGDGAEYRLEFDPSCRIKSFGVAGSGPQRWTMETGSGLIYSLGSQTDAQVKAIGCASVLTWAVSRITDTTGNAMDFFYDDTARQRGELLLTRIAYTSNAAQGLTARQEVVCDYEDRPESLPPPLSHYALPDPGTLAPWDGRYYFDAYFNGYPQPYMYQFYVTADLLSQAGRVGGGNPYYTYTSELSAAVIHAGILTPGQAGVVTIQNRPAPYYGNFELYPGSTRNGITSDNELASPGTGFQFLTNQATPVPQSPTTYVGGYGIRNLKRIRAIESRAQNSSAVMTRVRRYEMTYKQDALTQDSELISVQEFLSDGSALPPTQFEWPAITQYLIDLVPGTATGITSIDKKGGDFWAADFDGNGKADILTWNAPGAAGLFSLSLCNGTSFSAPTPTSITGGSPTRVNQFILGDYNGDGKTDIVAWNPTANQFKCYLSTGTDFGPGFDTGIPSTTSDHYMKPGDYDGDGRTDLLAWNAPGQVGKYSLMLSQGTSFATPIPTTITANTGLQNSFFTGAFNGDGMTDILLWNTSSARYDLYLATGSGFAAHVATTVPSNTLSTTGFVNTEPHLTGDFNGDGLTDLMITGLVPNVSMYNFFYCKGGSFTGPVPSGEPSNRIVNDERKGQMIDFNGDGKTDILMKLAADPGFFYVLELCSGDRFRTPMLLELGSGNDLDILADFNGDGKSDLLVWTPSVNQYKLWLNEGPEQRLVKQVTNGQGAYTKFSYKPLTDPSVHNFGTFSYPNVAVVAPLYVTATMTQSNGMDADPYSGDAPAFPAENTIDYTYYGAWATTTGRGFQGFNSVGSWDQARGRTSNSNFLIDPLLAGRAYHQEQNLVNVPSGGSALVQGVDTIWINDITTWPNGNKTYFTHEYLSYDRQYEPNRPAATALVKSTVAGAFSFDAYGSLLGKTTVVSRKGDGTDTDTFSEIVGNIFDNVTAGLWFPGRPTISSKTLIAPDGVPITRTAHFGYQPATGLLTSEVVEPADTGPLKLSAEHAYDGFGNRTSTTTTANGEAARTSGWTYSPDGRFSLTRSNAAGHSETLTYDPLLGSPLTQTGPNGLTTTNQYDAMGRPVREFHPDGTETRTFHRLVTGSTTGTPPRAVHYVVKQSSGSAPETRWFDRLDREIRSDSIALDGRTISTHRIFTAEGLEQSVSDPCFSGGAFQYTTRIFDSALRLIQSTAPGTRTTSTANDGLTTTVTNPLGQTATTVTNLMGWTVQSIDNAGRAVTKTYDAQGNLRTLADPLGHITELRYDLLGRKTWMSEPNAGISIFTYNGFGELLSQTDAKNQTISIAYDKLGRPLSRTEPEGATTFTYDSASKGIGQLASEARSGFTRVFSYDAVGRPAITLETHGADTFATSRSYDQYGRVASITYPTGFAVRRIYNSRGYLTSVQNAATGQSYWRADTANVRGQITSETFGNGVQALLNYDLNTGLLKSVYDAYSVLFEEYEFDKIGNLTQRRDSRFTTNLFTETFSYDGLNRLTHVATTGAAAVDIAYDDLGNVTSRSDVGSFTYGANGAGPHAVTSITGPAAKTCVYDAKGNRTLDGAKVITYNSFDKPVTITQGSETLGFTYATDRALSRQAVTQGTTLTSERDYIGGIYEREKQADGSVENTHYIQGVNGVVAIYTERQSGQGLTRKTCYVHKDHLGSVSAISDSDRAVVERLSYDAWGRRRTLKNLGSSWTVEYDAALSDLNTHRGYTGHEMLESVALVHMGGRVYDPITGRMLSPDPIVQDPSSLQSVNRYSYVMNNPLSMTDPSGFMMESLFIPQIGDYYSGSAGGYNMMQDMRMGMGYEVNLSAPNAQRISSQGDVGFYFNGNNNFGASYSGFQFDGGVLTNALFGGDGGYMAAELESDVWARTFETSESGGGKFGIGAIMDTFEYLIYSEGHHDYKTQTAICNLDGNACSLSAQRGYFVDDFSAPLRLNLLDHDGKLQLLGGSIYQDILVDNQSQVSVRNTTAPGHFFEGGHVDRTIYESGGKLWVETHGVGSNIGPFRAWLNQTSGPLLFKDLDFDFQQHVAIQQLWSRFKTSPVRASQP